MPKSLLLTAALGLLALTFPIAGGAGRNAPAAGTTLTIVSDLPLQGSDRAQTTQMVRAIQFVLRQSGGKAGKYSIRFVPHDDSIAGTGKWDEARCTANARGYVANPQVVGVIGTYNSGCAALEIPILNEAPIAMVSPANTYPGLTRNGPGTDRTEPYKYYPTGTRNYARVVAADDFQGVLGAAYMKNVLGVHRVYVLDDVELYGQGVADVFAASAASIGLKVVGRSGWSFAAPNYKLLMKRIKASGADGIYIGGVMSNNGGQLIRDKVAFVGDNRRVKVLVSDGFVLSSLYDEAGRQNVVGLRGTAPTTPPDKLTGPGRALVAAFARTERGKPIEVYTPYAMAAAQVLLDAIKRSNGTRADVLAKLRSANLPNTAVGPISFDPNGDPKRASESVYEATPDGWAYLQTKRR